MKSFLQRLLSIGTFTDRSSHRAYTTKYEDLCQ
jgi:hypothetical protein